jgi:hypothetical protein
VAVALVNDFVEDAGEVALGQAGRTGMIPHLVQDQQVGTAVLLQPVIESVISHRGEQILERVVGADVADAIAGGASAHAQPNRQMALADTNSLAFFNFVKRIRDRFSNCCVIPLGQRTSTLVITAFVPNPKCNRVSLVEL